MTNIAALARRRWATSVKAQTASLVIALTVTTAWLLYWGYMQHMGAAMAARVEAPPFPGDFAISLPPDSPGFVVGSTYATPLQSYFSLEVETAYGRQALAAVSMSSRDAPLPRPAAGEVWLPNSVSALQTVAVGDELQIRVPQGLHYHTLAPRVAGFYPAYEFVPAIVIDRSWLLAQGIQVSAPEITIYRRSEQFNRWSGRLPEGASLITAATAAEQARGIVDVAFSSGGAAVSTLFIFLLLGVGTFCLLTYLDSRRELALLKSMGLRPKELGALFVLEGVCTAVLAFVLAGLAAGWLDHRTSLPIELDGRLLIRAFGLCALAIAGAISLPYLLTQRASVNELMFGRPVPVFRTRIQQLLRRHPALEPLLSAGYALIKLPANEDGFPGICFRQAGEAVKANETLAWESLAWGLGEREYLAPCDGIVQSCDLQQGLIVIKPYAI